MATITMGSVLKDTNENVVYVVKGIEIETNSTFRQGKAAVYLSLWNETTNQPLWDETTNQPSRSTVESVNNAIKDGDWVILA